MHELTGLGCAFSEILANGTYASDFSVCGLTRFDDVLFNSKIAVKDEAEIADGSRKLSIGIVQTSPVSAH